MKKLEFKKSSLPSPRNLTKETAGEAVVDFISPKAPVNTPTETVPSVPVKSEEKPKKAPHKRFTEKTFRIENTQIKALGRLKDQYNAARGEDQPSLSIDEIGRLMARLILGEVQEKGIKETIDKLRGLN